ncbi:MAG: hypothetical protein U5L04_13725 [Trueperaceae bacterium]|nr:hypothetical protein [Trueperaceae bacterium]MDZ7705529.1 hypothetical protein [Trueperaceae bacterium]
MPKGKGVAQAFEQDLQQLGKGDAQPKSTESETTVADQESTTHDKRTPSTPRPPRPKATKLRQNARGEERGDDLQRLNITLPSDVLNRADTEVLRRKQNGDRAANRSSLIQEALEKLLGDAARR